MKKMVDTSTDMPVLKLNIGIVPKTLPLHTVKVGGEAEHHVCSALCNIILCDKNLQTSNRKQDKKYVYVASSRVGRIIIWKLILKSISTARHG